MHSLKPPTTCAQAGYPGIRQYCLPIMPSTGASVYHNSRTMSQRFASGLSSWMTNHIQWWCFEKVNVTIIDTVLKSQLISISSASFSDLFICCIKSSYYFDRSYWRMFSEVFLRFWWSKRNRFIGHKVDFPFLPHIHSLNNQPKCNVRPHPTENKESRLMIEICLLNRWDNRDGEWIENNKRRVRVTQPAQIKLRVSDIALKFIEGLTTQ